MTRVRGVNQDNRFLRIIAAWAPKTTSAPLTHRSFIVFAQSDLRRPFGLRPYCSPRLHSAINRKFGIAQSRGSHARLVKEMKSIT